MSERKRKKVLYPFLCNILIVVFAAIGVGMHFAALGFGMFRYYTLCSNFFLLIACGICAWYGLLPLLGKRSFMPNWAIALKYLAVCTVVMTFLVVVFVLTPMGGGWAVMPHFLFSVGMIWHHFLCPLLGLFSLLLIDRTDLSDTRLPAYALLPTLLYAVVVTILNVVGTVNGPYPFLRVREQPVFVSVFWYVLLAGLALLIAWGVWRLNGLCSEKEERRVRKAPPEEDGYTADGYIRDQDCFSSYTYRTIPASFNSCGCVAAFNLRRYRGQEVTYGEVVREMDRMHLLRLPGPTMMYVMRRYVRRYLPGVRETHGWEAAFRAGQESDMGIFRYREEHVPHFVSYIQAGEGQFRFFNVSDDAEDRLFSVESFMREHCVEGPVRLLYWKRENVQE